MLPFNDGGALSGLVCGILFGVALENAGFGSPCKLTGQFRLTDWSVLKVMFTAIVVAAAGLEVLQRGGWMSTDGVFVPSALLMAAAIGGALVGAGFAIGGYCPGTSVVGLLSGRLDAAVFLAGLLIGTFAFAGLYGPTIEALMQMAELQSGDTFTDAFGWSSLMMIALMALALWGVFVLGSRMERNSRGPVTAEEAVTGAH